MGGFQTSPGRGTNLIPGGEPLVLPEWKQGHPPPAKDVDAPMEMEVHQFEHFQVHPEALNQEQL